MIEEEQGPREPKYQPSERMVQQIENSFTYHAPVSDQPERYIAIRAKAKELADMIVSETPVSREQSIAITKLEEAMMFANAAIARNEG